MPTAGLILGAVLLSQSPQCWDYKPEALYLARSNLIFETVFNECFLLAIAPPPFPVTH